MSFVRGAAVAASAAALLAGCAGSAADPTAGTTSVLATPTTDATLVETRSPAPSTPATTVRTVTVTASATARPTSRPASRPTPKPARAQCPITAAKLSAVLGAKVERIGIGPVEPLEEPPGVSAAGCTFATSGGDATTISFTTGYGADGEKLWAYVPKTCTGIGGSIISLGISIKNCTVAEVVRRSVVHRDGSVVWIDVNLPDGAPPAFAANVPDVVETVLATG